MPRYRFWRGSENDRHEITDGIFRKQDLPEYPDLETAVDKFMEEWVDDGLREAIEQLGHTDWSDDSAWIHIPCEYFCDPLEVAFEIGYMEEDFENEDDEEIIREEICASCERSEWFQVEEVEEMRSDDEVTICPHCKSDYFWLEVFFDGSLSRTVVDGEALEADSDWEMHEIHEHILVCSNCNVEFYECREEDADVKIEADLELLYFMAKRSRWDYGKE